MALIDRGLEILRNHSVVVIKEPEPSSGAEIPPEAAGTYAVPSISEPGETAQDPAAEYLFYDADQRYLSWEEVSRLSHQAACYAKNEIYARHGRQFVSLELQQYFGSKSWYRGTISPAAFSDSVFNPVEKANVDLLVQAERFIGNGFLYPLDQPGYNIQAVGTASRE